MPRRRTPRLLLGALAGGGVAGWVAALLHVAHLWDRNSDTAWQMVAGFSMAAGNWRLTHWTLAMYNSWLTDIPVYALASKLTRSAEQLYVVPLVLYVAAVIAACWLAVVAAPIRRLLAMALVVALVGLPAPLLAYTALQGGIHIGTDLFALVALALLARFVERPNALPWALAALVVAAGVASDPLFEVIAPLPAIGASLLLWRDRSRSLLTAAAAAAGLAAGYSVQRFGLLRGFGTSAFGISRAPLHTWWPHVQLAWQSLRLYLGGDSYRLAPLAEVVAIVTIAAVVAAAVWQAATMRDERRTPVARWLGLALAGGILGNVAAFVVTTVPVDLYTSRYLTPAVFLSAVLLARTVAELSPAAGPRLRRASTAALAGIAAAHLALFGLLVSEPALPASPSLLLSRWLTAHDLRSGYGPYWAANILTAQSGGTVLVRPVAGAGGRLVPLHYASDGSWYTDASYAASPPRFVVLATHTLPGPDYGIPSALVVGPDPTVNEESAAATFGPPNTMSTVGPYQVLIWDQPLTGVFG